MLICSALLSWAGLAQTTSQPPPVQTSITVIGDLAAEAPASVSVVSSEVLKQTPGDNLDDRLRSVPGFSLFRRTSSLVANPTTQGVSLRGLGSTGASRTLVLWDGIPLNDPFGGWVYWTRVDPEELGRVEVSRGASTSLFGDRAMGGVIALFTREPEPYRLSVSLEAGNRGTVEAAGGYSQVWRRWAASGRVRTFTTDGYYIVPQTSRGAADTPANVRFAAGDIRFDYLGSRNRAFLKLDILAEERGNGTLLTANSTGLGTLAGSYTRDQGAFTVSALGYHTREQFHASFSSISADRNTERVTYRQTVPAEATGGAAYVQRRARRWSFLAGGDAQRSEGTSTDRLVPTGVRIGGGTLTQRGIFVQGNASAGPLRLFLGAREQWTGRDQRFFSPNFGLSAGRGAWRGRGSVYRSFRAPTLNELYREFRVGNTITQANAGLRPETLFGAEAGLDWTSEATRVSVSAFRNELNSLITNVTLSSSGGTIVRQRQNAAGALGRGVEAQIERRWGHWSGQAGYLFAESRFLTGERIPQTPKHQGTAQLAYQREGTLISGGLRSYGLQFEDDRNQFLLPGFAVLQATARQRIRGPLSAYVMIDNLLDRQFVVGFSPTPLIGAPLLWRAGLRWDGPIP